MLPAQNQSGLSFLKTMTKDPSNSGSAATGSNLHSTTWTTALETPPMSSGIWTNAGSWQRAGPEQLESMLGAMNSLFFASAFCQTFSNHLEPATVTTIYGTMIYDAVALDGEMERYENSHSVQLQHHFQQFKGFDSQCQCESKPLKGTGSYTPKKRLFLRLFSPENAETAKPHGIMSRTFKGFDSWCKYEPKPLDKKKVWNANERLIR